MHVHKISHESFGKTARRPMDGYGGRARQGERVTIHGRDFEVRAVDGDYVSMIPAHYTSHGTLQTRPLLASIFNVFA